jgi:predicted nucleotidyltransferase
MTNTSGMGSSAHRSLIDHVVAHYRHDIRVRAVAVFGSVAAGTWHELSDVDFDIVIEDSARIAPAEEITAMFGSRAVVMLARPDSADVVLDSLEELSMRWHLLRATSPNIAATARVLAGQLTDRELAAGEANRVANDAERLLDAAVRDLIGARKALVRGRDWDAVAAIERARRSLTQLRGHRDCLLLEPCEPARALAAVVAGIQAAPGLGARRRALRATM